MPEPGNVSDQQGGKPDMSAAAECARMRAVMRASGKHREGGVDPKFKDATRIPPSDTWARVRPCPKAPHWEPQTDPVCGRGGRPAERSDE